MKILYVDDELSILELAKIFFEDQKVVIQTASSALQAFEMCQTNRFDIIISDERMPQLRGTEFFYKLRHDLGYRGLCVLLSGHMELTEDDLKKIGIDRMILKPIDFDQLHRDIVTLITAQKSQGR
jgi:DNA-binding response OmpR family regulator